MTTSEFLSIQSGLVSASILIDRDLQRAKNTQETRYIRRMAEKIDAGLRTLKSIEGDRIDLPRVKQAALEVVS